MVYKNQMETLLRIRPGNYCLRKRHPEMDTKTNRNPPTKAHYRPQVVPRLNTLRLAETDQF